MNLVQAIDIVNDCARAKRLMGMNAVFPYKPDQFVDALIAMKEHIEGTKVQINTLTKQLSMANARAAKGGPKNDGVF